MQHKSSIEVARYAIRAKICTKCYQRPYGSETLGPLVPRGCEQRCTIFTSLPEVHKAMLIAPASMAPDELMRKFICPTCQASATAGDFCEEALTRTCPLSRYSADLLKLLDDLRHTSTQAAPWKV